MGLKQNTQAFTGAPKQRGNTYPDINAAQDLTDRIGVTKNPLNLKKLETITKKWYSDIVAEVIVMLMTKLLSLLDSIQACIIPVIYTMMEMDMTRPVTITTN